MLVTTWTPNDGYVHTGDILTVDQRTADRWLGHHIAEECKAETAEVTTDEQAELPTSEQSEVISSAVPERKKRKK
jgi:hypothetical protein